MKIISPAGGESVPQASPAELNGRLVAFLPLALEKQPGNNPGDPERDTIRADVVVFGQPGEAFQYGQTEGKFGVAQPKRRQVTLPAILRGGVYGAQELVRAMRPGIDSQGETAVVGVIEKGTQGQRPWLLQRLAADDPRMALVAGWFAQVAGQKTAGTYVEQEPLTIAETILDPAKQQTAASYQAPAVQQPVQVAPVVQQVAPAIQRPASIPEAVWATMPPAAQAAVAASVPAAPAGPDLSKPVAGLEQAWQYMDENARAAAWAAATQPQY